MLGDGMMHHSATRGKEANPRRRKSRILGASIRCLPRFLNIINFHIRISDHAGNTKNPCSNSRGTVWTARSAAALPDQSGQLDPMAPLRRAPRPSRVSCGKFWRPWLQRRRKDAEKCRKIDHRMQKWSEIETGRQIYIYIFIYDVYIYTRIYLAIKLASYLAIELSSSI